MQALVNTSVDSSSHVYLLQRVVEGLHVHVCVDTCTLEFKVDVHSIDVRPVRYYDNIVYRDIFTNIAIRYFLLAITITAIEILCAKGRGSSTK